MSRTGQRKGRRAEIELSELLNEHGFQTRPGAPVSFGGEPDIVGIPGIHAEVKRRECLDVNAALVQAEEDACFFGDGLPTVFTRANRKKWRVVMTLEAWIELYRRGGDNRQNKDP